MASSKKASFFMVTLLLLLTITVSTAMGPAAAPSPLPDCSSVLLSMADCLGYVEIGNTNPKPDASCCEGLSSVLSVSPLCLCQVLEDSASLGIVLNTTRAVGLADACSLKAPPVTSLCPGFATAPTPSAPSPSVVIAPSVPLPVSPPSAAASPVPSSPHESRAAALTVSSFLLFLFVGVMFASHI